jgi:tetratricopeptide (TPR) repeat protein
MLIKFFKLILVVLFLIQNPLYAKNSVLIDFNSRDLSNYFSGIIAYENQDNLEALNFFRSSRILMNKHDPYLKRYVYSLVLENKTKQASIEIKQNLKNDSSNFFEAHLILALESLKKKNFDKSIVYLEQSHKFINNDRIALVIYETIKQYLLVFEEGKISKTKTNFGKISFINEVFQKCYLGDKNTENNFKIIINNKEDYSRYIFFLINYLIENNKLDKAQSVISEIDYLNSSLLIAQSKEWIKKNEIKKIEKIFSCKNPNDLISEFIFLIGNLYASQSDYEKSNFYLNIANYLNPNFKFNLSVMVENYYFNKDYEKTKKILKSFDEKDSFYYWFKLKKKAQIISKEKSDQKSLKFINQKFEKINNPSIKTIFDIANFNKNSKKYQNAINHYDLIISKIDVNTNIYAEILYRRGSSHERLGNYLKSDEDFLKSLEINPEDTYVLNYLAYSWLEREYKIEQAIQMLEKAYKLRSNDPYIIDSIGWGYYMVSDFVKAEKFLKRAVELMPNDPIVNDHYGDILWKLNRKIQARYFWTSVLSLEDTEDKMKKDIYIKLIEGLTNS